MQHDISIHEILSTGILRKTVFQSTGTLIFFSAEIQIQVKLLNSHFSHSKY